MTRRSLLASLMLAPLALLGRRAVDAPRMPERKGVVRPRVCEAPKASTRYFLGHPIAWVERLS